MHFENGTVPEAYQRYVTAKARWIWAVAVLTACAFVLSICMGAVTLPLSAVLKSLAGMSDTLQVDIIVRRIRLPQALSAILAGAGLAAGGAVMQAVLRNPLGSPFTLGISHAAAFGAALSVMILGSGIMGSTTGDAVTVVRPGMTTISAFLFSMCAAGIITLVSRIRSATPEVMVLTGVALGSLFTAATMLLQFFADDVQLAAMVFWTFGDVARTSWRELGIMTVVTLAGLVFFMFNAWQYNAMDTGDDTARGVGVRVGQVRLAGMMAAALITSVTTAFVGIIGFVGLVAPHMCRRFVGDDHRYLLPASALTGALILLVSDTAARLILAPHLLPVSILTAFLGAPVFLFLIIRGRR